MKLLLYGQDENNIYILNPITKTIEKQKIYHAIKNLKFDSYSKRE